MAEINDVSLQSGSGSRKDLIVHAKEEEYQLQGRIAAVEASLQEMGAHFVKYQEDFTKILVDECIRISQQMQHQKDKLKQHVTETVHEAVARAREETVKEMSRTREEIRGEINAEWCRMRDSLLVSKQSTNKAASVPGVDMEMHESVMKLMDSLSKNIVAGQSDVLHMSKLEKRVALLETSLGSQKTDVKGVSRFSSNEQLSVGGSIKYLIDKAAGAKGKDELCHTRETVSTVSLSEAEDKRESILKDIDAVNRDLNQHKDCFYLRLAALETGNNVQQSCVKDAPGVEQSPTGTTTPRASLSRDRQELLSTIEEQLKSLTPAANKRTVPTLNRQLGSVQVRVPPSPSPCQSRNGSVSQPSPCQSRNGSVSLCPQRNPSVCVSPPPSDRRRSPPSVPRNHLEGPPGKVSRNLSVGTPSGMMHRTISPDTAPDIVLSRSPPSASPRPVALQHMVKKAG